MLPVINLLLKKLTQTMEIRRQVIIQRIMRILQNIQMEQRQQQQLKQRLIHIKTRRNFEMINILTY